MKKQIATSLDADLIKSIKIFCATNDYQINQFIENASYLFLAIENNESFREIIDCIPSSKVGCKIQGLLEDQI
jgi:hypothetical protein